MGAVILFLLAVLFVAAVWGQEAAQKLFKGGAAIAAFLFALVAIFVIVLAIKAQPPSPETIRKDLASSANSPYHVPLDNGQGYSDPGAALRRPEPVYAPPTLNTAAPVATSPSTTGYSAPANGYTTDLGNPKIGVVLERLQPQNGARYNLPPGYGVYVRAVLPRSVAQQAGIVSGDYISQVDGTWITSVDTLNINNVGKRAGDVVTLRVLRGGSQYLVRIALGNP